MEQLSYLSNGWGRGVDATHPPPKRFSSLSWELEELLFQTNFLSAGTLLGHLSMKTFFRLELLSWP